MAKYTRTITDGDFLRDIKRVAKRNGNTITVAVYKAEGQYGLKSISQRFGTWRRAVLIAGITPYFERNPLTMPTSKDEQRAAMIEKRDLRRRMFVDEVKVRPCLRCGRDFSSTWAGNRRCASCEKMIEREGATFCDQETGRAGRSGSIAVTVG